MRICVITGTFHPEIGGPPVYLYNLCGWLKTQGHDISVLCFGDERGRYDYPYTVRRISRKYPLLIRLALFILQLLRLGRKSDILYVNDYGFPVLLANLLLRKYVVIKIVGDFAWEYSVRHSLISRHEDIDDFQKRSYGLKVGFLKALQRLYVDQAGSVITPSRYLKKLITGWGIENGKVHVIHNAVSLSPARPGGDKGTARKQCGLGRDDRVILTICRLTPWKGVDDLIAVFPGIKKVFKKAKLVVIGDGPEKARLEEEARRLSLNRDAVFTGVIPHEKIKTYLTAADLFILNSGYEGFSHVLLEAMAACLPVIASRKGGNPELVSHGKNGILVPYRDRPRLEKAIFSCLARPEYAKRLGKSAGRRALAFLLEHMVRETLAILKRAR